MAIRSACVNGQRPAAIPLTMLSIDVYGEVLSTVELSCDIADPLQNIREIVPIDSPDFGRVFNVTIGAMMARRGSVCSTWWLTNRSRRSAASTRR
jgi:hypothetical protein